MEHVHQHHLQVQQHLQQQQYMQQQQQQNHQQSFPFLPQANHTSNTGGGGGGGESDGYPRTSATTTSASNLFAFRSDPGTRYGGRNGSFAEWMATAHPGATAAAQPVVQALGIDTTNDAIATATTAFAAATTLNDDDDHHHNAATSDRPPIVVDEFVLVDGDLVAIPPHAPNAAEQLGYEDLLRDQVKTCQPKGLKRHVRRFNRFLFKRGMPGSAGINTTRDENDYDEDGPRPQRTPPHQQQQQQQQQHRRRLQQLQTHERRQQRERERRLLELRPPQAQAIERSTSDPTVSYAAIAISHPLPPLENDRLAPVWMDAHAASASAMAMPALDPLAPPSAVLPPGGLPSPTSPPSAAAPTPAQALPKRKRMPRLGLGRKQRPEEKPKRAPSASTVEEERRSGPSAANAGAVSRRMSHSSAASVASSSTSPLTSSPSRDNVSSAASAEGRSGSVTSAWQDPLFAPRPSLEDPSQSLYALHPGSGNDAATDATAEEEAVRAGSVTASFVGTADQLLVEGVLPAGIAAEAYIEDDYDLRPGGGYAFGGGDEDAAYKSKLYADDLVPSLVPPQSDWKVDKADAPDFEALLHRAALEAQNDMDHSQSEAPPPPYGGALRGKSEDGTDAAYLPLPGAPVPLSSSHEGDYNVHNDLLKVVLVGNLLEKSWLARAIRQVQHKRPPKRTTLALDVRTWSPPAVAPPAPSDGTPGSASVPVKFQIWDVQGATSTIDGSPNFGGHPATQSLFFSSQSLYILVWDMAGSNLKTYHRRASSTFKRKAGVLIAGSSSVDDSDSDDDDEDDADDEEDFDNEFVREEANRQADRALHAEIRNQVLSWVEWIAKRGPKSAILPVTIVPECMEEFEVTRRSTMMQSLLEQHVQRWLANPSAPKLLTGAEGILRVGYGGSGLEQLRDTLIAIATDSSKSVFEHVGTPVPEGTPLIQEICRRLKVDHKLLLLDHLLVEIGPTLSPDQVVEALHYLASTGEILYFGSPHDDVLSRYVVLSRKWLVSAISCILRNDLKRELAEARRFMNMQCLYSDRRYEENEIAHALAGSTTSSCPLLSDQDAQMLWQSMSFMREAADRSADLGDCPATTPSLFAFLERLLVSTGVLVPVACSQGSLDRSQVFFVPSLLAQVDPRDVWTYRTSESWMTTLCHSWLFRDGAPANLMENITVSVLRDLYEFSRTFHGTLEKKPPSLARTVPMRPASLHEFYEAHNEQPIGRFRIHQIMCWQTSVLIKLGTVFAEPDSNELRESFVEILITMVDQSSDMCVASDAMRSGMHRIIVSAKGQVGHHGRKIWKGGYRRILDTISSTLSSHSNVDSQVVCPECLAHLHPHSASTWSTDSVQAAADDGTLAVRCMRGHRVETHLICGCCKDALKAPPDESGGGLSTRHPSAKPVAEILPSVVLVGLWDPNAKQVKRVGSGFVVDRKLGLVVTAAHVLYNWDEGANFGTPYDGIADAKVVVGVLHEDNRTAVFRYFGKVLCDDVHHMDACVVRITTRLEADVDDEGAGCADQAEVVLGASELSNEDLRSLKLAKRFDLEEAVRIYGFNQGGEGVFEQGSRVHRHVDVAKGYISGEFKVSATVSDDSSSRSSDSDAPVGFVPREEIVVMCPTIPGHSGGPCVNEDGRVVGILSRADPVSRLRCYLVPYSELRALVKKARSMCASRPPAAFEGSLRHSA